MKFLVVGCGSIGERHIRNLKSLGAGKIMAQDIDPKRLLKVKKKYSVETYENIEEALRRKPDAVLVCAPTSLHVPIALSAVNSGCHVFIEKPISHNLDKVDDLIEAAKKRKLIIFVGFNMRFNSNLIKIKELLDERKIGKVISARVHFGSYLPDRHPWEDYREGYGAKKSLGGGVILDAIHQVDLVRWFLGDIKEVFCYSDKMSSLEIDVEDNVEIFFKLKSGAVATLHLDFVQRPPQLSCQLIGEEGTITWDFWESKVKFYDMKSKKWEIFHGDKDPNEMYIREIRHFINCIKTKKNPPVDGVMGKELLEIALVAKKSSEEGRLIELD